MLCHPPSGQEAKCGGDQYQFSSSSVSKVLVYSVLGLLFIGSITMILREMLDGLPDRPHFNFFSFRDVNPVSGRSKQRTVAAPNDAMKILQRRFLKRLRSEENVHVRARLSLCATSSNSG